MMGCSFRLSWGRAERSVGREGLPCSCLHSEPLHNFKLMCLQSRLSVFSQTVAFHLGLLVTPLAPAWQILPPPPPKCVASAVKSSGCKLFLFRLLFLLLLLLLLLLLFTWNFHWFLFFIFAARLLKVVKHKTLPLNTSSSNEIRVRQPLLSSPLPSPPHPSLHCSLCYPLVPLSGLSQQIEVEVCGLQSSANMQLFLVSLSLYFYFVASSLIALGNCLFCFVLFHLVFFCCILPFGFLLWIWLWLWL